MQKMSLCKYNTKYNIVQNKYEAVYVYLIRNHTVLTKQKYLNKNNAEQKWPKR